MIQITFNPKEYALSVEGHAGQDEMGKDIVCAAISILFYTLAESLHKSERMLEEEPVINIEEGNGHISCKPKKEYVGNITRTYWTILNGIELVADSYEEYVSFNVTE